MRPNERTSQLSGARRRLHHCTFGPGRVRATRLSTSQLILFGVASIATREAPTYRGPIALPAGRRSRYVIHAHLVPQRDRFQNVSDGPT